LAAEQGIIPIALAQQVGAAYMALRTAQHRCKLLGQDKAWLDLSAEPGQQLLGNAQCALQLWGALGLTFNEPVA
jgi:hypothetical protein